MNAPGQQAGSYTQVSHDSIFKKAMGRLDALFVGFGAMIGFGWIVLAGGWIEEAGTMGALLAFAGGGVIMAFVGVVYSELVAAMPLAGGEHNYLMRAMGPKLSMIGSWCIVGGYITVVMFEAVAVPKTALYLLPDIEKILLWNVAGFDVYLTWALIGVVTAIILTYINIRGVKVASLVQTFVVSFLLIVGLLLVTGAGVGGDMKHVEPWFSGGFNGFALVLTTVPFLFVGFDVLPQAAEEINVKPRQIGKLVVMAVLMAAAWYVVIIFTTSISMPHSDIAALNADGGLVTADALSAMLGHPTWGKIVIAGGLAGIITSWNAFLMGASRLMWALAQSGMLPAWFGKIHPTYRTPINALLFIGTLSVIAPFLGSAMLGWVVDAGSPMIVITYFLVSIAFIKLRKNEPHMERPMRVGGKGNGGIVIGAISALLCLFLFVLYLPITPWSAQLAWPSWLMFGLWLAVGVVLMLRLPGGVQPGPNAEAELLKKLGRESYR
ncbi:APC family permease [Brevibacterium ravenspurgense]|uniref:APC family permease n=1 Tax=Brevibacterium ravenspurgense TaxID=479117 RepID=UPI0002F8FD1B|nr:APC family permease [Brevibacterium ravenspurgense]